MIAKCINRTSGDHFGRLVRYIAAASDKGEKLDALWLAGCDAGDSDQDPAADPDLLDMAIREIEATQALNTRAKSNKTYHLILSFRNDRPDLAALKDIETQFAAALGFADHQRVVATHQNTDNFHMHVAFNKVHPVTLNCVTPFQDFKALEATCRAVEKQYGLSVDNGREDIVANRILDKALSPSARDFEAHRWEQSFERQVKALSSQLDTHLETANNWQDLHEGFAEQYLRLRLRGNGLVITGWSNRHRIKASTLGRQFSKPALEKHFGPFEAYKRKRQRPKPTQAAKPFAPRPLARDKRQNQLWARYLDQAAGSAATRRKDSLTRRAFSSWKAFLQAEAINDPLAPSSVFASFTSLWRFGALLVFVSQISVCILCASHGFALSRLSSLSLPFKSGALAGAIPVRKLVNWAI